MSKSRRTVRNQDVVNDQPVYDPSVRPNNMGPGPGVPPGYVQSHHGATPSQQQPQAGPSRARLPTSVFPNQGPQYLPQPQQESRPLGTSTPLNFQYDLHSGDSGAIHSQQPAAPPQQRSYTQITPQQQQQQMQMQQQMQIHMQQQQQMPQQEQPKERRQVPPSLQQMQQQLTYQQQQRSQQPTMLPPVNAQPQQAPLPLRPAPSFTQQKQQTQPDNRRLSISGTPLVKASVTDALSPVQGLFENTFSQTVQHVEREMERLYVTMDSQHKAVEAELKREKEIARRDYLLQKSRSDQVEEENRRLRADYERLGRERAGARMENERLLAELQAARKMERICQNCGGQGEAIAVGYREKSESLMKELQDERSSRMEVERKFAEAMQQMRMLTNTFSVDRNPSEAPTVIGSPGRDKKHDESDHVDEQMVLPSPIIEDRSPYSLSRAASSSQARQDPQSPIDASASPVSRTSLPVPPTVPVEGEPPRKRTRVDFEEDDSGSIKIKEEIKEDPDEIEVDELEEGELNVDSTPTTPITPSSAHRNRIGINHLDLLYETKNQTLVCRLCTSRRERANPAINPATFSLGATWKDLLGHCQQMHPASCAELEGKSPAQVAELRQRLLSKPNFDVGNNSRASGSHTRKNSKS